MENDIRMRGFVKRKDIKEVIDILRDRIKPLDSEIVDFNKGINRVLAKKVLSDRNVPSFERSAMDGYAVRAQDTFGASDTNPLVFEIIGEVFIGEKPSLTLEKNQAVRIMTGCAIPSKSDAVVMAEYTEEDNSCLKIFAPVSPGKNVHHICEDIKKGEVIIKKGTLLKPQHIGILSSVQQLKINVIKKPTVAIIATGNEIICPLEKKDDYKIVDSNSYILESQVGLCGAIPVMKGIIPDDKEKIRKVLKDSKEDVIIISGGTSVGKKDYSPILVTELGELLVHGVSMRPGSPTGVGFINDKPVFLLAGNPVAAMVGFDCFVLVALKLLCGLSLNDERVARVKLTKKINSGIGRTDFVRVIVNNGMATPVRVSGAGVLTTMTRSDGIIIVSKNIEGIEEGETVEVNLF